MAKSDTTDNTTTDTTDTTGNGTDTKKQPDILVDPETLVNLSNKIWSLIDTVGDAKTKMDAVNIIPGLFADAQNFKKQIGLDDGGRANVYSTHLQNLETALTNFSNGLYDIAKNYSNAEDMNKNLVQQLGELKQQVDPYIPGSPSGA